MAAFLPVNKFFEHVYLVDLSPSLCEVARQRFDRLGWKNVTVLCQDARSFRLPERPVDPRSVTNAASDAADLITMSYSLSMIPGAFSMQHPKRMITDFALDYYSVVDSLTSRLTSSGILGVCDFYGRQNILKLMIISDFHCSSKHCGCVLP